MKKDISKILNHEANEYFELFLYLRRFFSRKYHCKQYFWLEKMTLSKSLNQYYSKFKQLF